MLRPEKDVMGVITELEKEAIRAMAKTAGVTLTKSLKVFRAGRQIYQAENEKDLKEYLELHATTPVEVTTYPYEFKMPPLLHQQKGFYLYKDRKYFAFFMEMQTGKTKLTLDHAGYLFERGEIDALVVVAPSGVHRKWIAEEIPKHLPDRIKTEAFFWKSESTVAQEKTRADFLLHPKVRTFQIVSFNFEALTTLKGQNFFVEFSKSRQCMGVIDEGHYIKTHNAKRTKFLLKTAGLFKYRRLLTGTPVTQSPLDVWAQMEWLSPDVFQCRSFYAFRVKHAKLQAKYVGAQKLYEVVVGYQRLDELSDRLEPWSYRVLKKDCLDLPPQQYRVEEVPLSPEQKKLYVSLKEQLFAEMGDQQMTTPIVLTKYLRLQQILGGFWTPDGDEVQKIPGKVPKLERLLELLQEIDPTSSAIIWARFVPEIKMISEALRKEYGEESVVEYYGETSGEDRQTAVQKIQEKTTRFFVGNPRAGGVGLTLNAANYMIYFSNDFSLDVRLQSEARIHGIGQTLSTCYIDLVTENSLDQVVLKALRSKKNLADTITKDSL